jgi:hypothetical protein
MEIQGSICVKDRKHFFSSENIFVSSRVGKNPAFFKKPSPVGFFGFIGFYWVLLGFLLGCIGFY